jgi:hypothetical protein
MASELQRYEWQKVANATEVTSLGIGEPPELSITLTSVRDEISLVTQQIKDNFKLRAD